MKSVQIHDGTILEFPDETPDEVIDAVVKTYNPEQKEPEPISVIVEQIGQLIHALYDSVQMQQRTTEMVIQSIQEQANEGHQLIINSVNELLNKISILSSAITSPKTTIKTLINDEMGRPVGVRIMTEGIQQ